MKKLLMTAATLLVLGNAPVLAGSTVPKDMLGSYCATQSDAIGEENVLLLDDRKNRGQKLWRRQPSYPRRSL